MHQTDYYRVLGVERDADDKTIKNAYRKLAFEYHPDRNDGRPDVAEKMKAINEAYAVLSDPDKRGQYDRIRRQYGAGAHNRFRQTYTEEDIFQGSDIFHVFEEMTRSFGFRGFDEVFREFYGDGYRSFEVRRPGFHAKGFVFTGGRPSGSHPRSVPPPGGTLGKMSRFLLRKVGGLEIPEPGKDMEDTISLSPEHADSGGPFAYYHRNRKKKLVVRIPAGVREGQRIRLAGLGEPGRGGADDGDLYLVVRIHKPLLEKMKRGVAKLFR